MEKIKKHKAKDLWIDKGVWVDLSCCLCSHEDRICAANEKELLKEIDTLGWRILDSQKHQIIGDWCGNCGLK